MRGKKRERIIRTLLSELQPLTQYRLAKLSNCSFPWVHEFLKLLEKHKLVKGTTVINPKGLLNFWLHIRQRPKYKEYMIQKPLKFLKSIKLTYALTTYQGDNLLEHFLFPSRTDIYVYEADLPKWQAALLQKGALYGKGNFRILIDDEHVFYKTGTVDNFKIVALPQLILDLQSEGGVCGEAVERLLHQFQHVRRL